MPDRAAAAPAGAFRARRLGRLNLEVRQSIGRWKHAGFIALGLGIGLAISVAILLAAGVEAANIFEEFVVLTFFDRLGLSSVLIECSPLILVGLSAAVAFRVNFWNIGIEGQFFWGAIGATVIAIFDVGPPATRIGLMLILSLVGGFLWIAPPAIFKIKLGVNEVISTLLLNYVAYLFVLNQVYGAWQDKRDRFPHSEPFDAVERLPMLGWEKVHLGLLVSLAAVAFVWWLMQRSRFGAYMRFVGSNPQMALAAGIPVAMTVFLAVGLSGALSGAAGFVMGAAQEHRLTGTMAAGYGFSGIMIAFLARNNPVAVLVVAFMIGGLYAAGQSVKVFYSLPQALVSLIQAIVVMCVAASDFLVRYRLRWIGAGGGR